MKKRFKIVTLGCRTNQYESQAYSDQLEKVGLIGGEKNVDLCIVNTCTVTESADKKSFYQIRQLARKYPDAEIVVTGCLVERKRDEIEKLPGVSKVIGNLEKEKLISYLYPDIKDLPEFSIERFSAHTRAFVKIQDGCNSYCSYCVIPFVRGRSRSKPTAEIIREIEGLLENGYKEIVLTGINIGDFDEGLADLVRLVDDLPGLERLRISSIDPDEIDDDLLDAVIHGKNTCQSMHIVLQSGSNVVLKRMRRKYTKQEFIRSVNRLLAVSPEFTVTTDVIVGFPGETEGDFQETIDLISDLPFAKVHMFPFSIRPMTRAARMPNPVPHDVITERKGRLLRHVEKRAFALREEYVGKTVSVLVEGNDPAREGNMRGHTDNFIEVSFPRDGLKSNDLIEIKCMENAADGLVGRVEKMEVVQYACANS